MSPREELLLKVTYRNGQSLPAFGRNFLSALSLLAFHLMCPFSMPQWNSGAGVHFVRMPLSPPPPFFLPRLVNFRSRRLLVPIGGMHA